MQNDVLAKQVDELTTEVMKLRVQEETKDIKIKVEDQQSKVPKRNANASCCEIQWMSDNFLHFMLHSTTGWSTPITNYVFKTYKPNL